MIGTTVNLPQTLAEAQAARNEAFQRYREVRDSGDAHRVGVARAIYHAAIDFVQSLCEHPRFEDRGWGEPCCVVCGAFEADVVTMNRDAVGM